MQVFEGQRLIALLFVEVVFVHDLRSFPRQLNGLVLVRDEHLVELGMKSFSNPEQW